MQRTLAAPEPHETVCHVEQGPPTVGECLVVVTLSSRPAPVWPPRWRWPSL